MEVDSGAAYSVIDEKVYQELFSSNPLYLLKCVPVLKDYQNNIILH